MCQMMLYQPGDMVCWNEGRSCNPHLQWMIKKYGEGPFSICSVRDVPTQCTCYLEDFDKEAPPEQHHEQCNVRLRESVDHSQWISLETITGVVKDFSGAWFQLMSCPAC